MQYDEYDKKPLKGKIESISFSSNEFGSTILKIGGTLYHTWYDSEKMDLYPGLKVEHDPYIDIRYKPHKLMATQINKIVK